MSRGLGDVYKRQGQTINYNNKTDLKVTGAVSYTHLTLPTTPYV
ncbi:hypothetical protein JMUB7552_27580 [Staphylococcus aureus]